MRVFERLLNHSNIRTRIPFPIFDIYHFNWHTLNRTLIHNHAKNGCLMILIKGALNEKIYDKKLNLIEENDYYSPNISFINDKKGYHSVKALKPSNSLHIYYPKGHITEYKNSSHNETNSL